MGRYPLWRYILIKIVWYRQGIVVDITTIVVYDGVVLYLCMGDSCTTPPAAPGA